MTRRCDDCEWYCRTSYETAQYECFLGKFVEDAGELGCNVSDEEIQRQMWELGIAWEKSMDANDRFAEENC